MEAKIQVSLENVAHMLAGEWDEVAVSATSKREEDAALLRAVADAIIAHGDDLPTQLIELLPMTIHVADDGSTDEVEVEYGEDYDDAARDLWAGADYGEGDYRVTVRWRATDYAGHVVADGSFDLEGHTEEPECTEADEHEWTSEGEGGCDENPGVWSTGGTSMAFRAHCRHCGMRRIECTTGSHHNPGERDTTEYEPASSWCAECECAECECE